MNNLLSYCGLIDARISASEKDLPVIAWMSPVKCKLNSSIGITCEYPPPAAPPLIPNVGPCEGCLAPRTNKL